MSSSNIIMNFISIYENIKLRMLMCDIHNYVTILKDCNTNFEG